MVATRSDPGHVVGVVNRYMSNLGRKHWEAIKHILRYLRGTKDAHRQITVVKGYTNSDYPGNTDNRKSTSCYVFTYGGRVISWRSKLQECTGTSTTKVKYVVACNLTKEALWLDRLAYTFPQADPNLALAIINDSQGALAWVMNSVHHNASKHIEV